MPLGPTILQRYVLRELLRVATLAALALTAIIFVGLSLSQVRYGVSLLQIYDIIPYLLTMSLPYALPAAFLVASVFVFGRLSGQNEINAMRSSGVNLNHVIFPALAIAALISAGTFALNHYLLPWSMTRVRVMRERILSDVISAVGSVNREYQLGNYAIYVGTLDDRTGLWRNVAVIQFQGEIPARVMFARSGRCDVNEEQGYATLRLEEGSLMQPRMSGDHPDPPVRFKSAVYRIDLGRENDISPDQPKYFTFGRLLQELRRLREQTARIKSEPQFAAVQHPKSAKHAVKIELDRAWRRRSALARDLTEKVRAVEKLRASAEEAEGNALAARAACEAGQTRLGEIETNIAEHKQMLELFEAELRQLIAQKAPRERIEQQKQEVGRTAGALMKLMTQRDEAKAQVEQATRALQLSEKQLAERKAQLEAQERALAALQVEELAARNEWQEKHQVLSKLRVMERLLRAQTDFHFRNAAAAATLVFMLIGIPLGIFSKHGNVIMAFVISFFAVLIVYYPLTFIGQMLSVDNYLAPWLAQWLPNAVVGGAGFALTAWGIRR